METIPGEDPIEFEQHRIERISLELGKILPSPHPWPPLHLNR